MLNDGKRNKCKTHQVFQAAVSEILLKHLILYGTKVMAPADYKYFIMMLAMEDTTGERKI